MGTVTISKNFQIDIPQDIIQSLKIEPGQKMQIMVFDHRIELIPEREISAMRGFLKGINTEFQRDADRI